MTICIADRMQRNFASLISLIQPNDYIRAEDVGPSRCSEADYVDSLIMQSESADSCFVPLEKLLPLLQALNL